MVIIKMKDKVMVWNLEDILSDKAFDAFYDEIEGRIKMYDAFFEKVHPKMEEDDFMEYIEFDEKMTSDFYRLFAYASMMHASDLKSEVAELYKGKAENLGIKIGDASRKISHWIKGKEVKGKEILDDENAKRLFRSVPKVEYVLSHSREGAKYTLSEPEERMSSFKDADFKVADDKKEDAAKKKKK